MSCKGLVAGVLLTLLSLVSVSAQAEVTFYQPPPHLMKDGYMSNVYHRNGVDNHELVVGGWGDVYVSLLRFGLEGLPRSADAVYMDLYTGDSGGSAVPVGMHAWLLTSPWDESPKWGTPLYGYDLGNISAPTENSWYIIRLDSIYSAWKNNSINNEGFLFEPLATDNRFNRFRSSDIPSSERQFRPILRVYYTPTVSVPAFKSPLPGGQSWLLTTEIGGTDCRAYVLGGEYPLPTHRGENFFAIDLAPNTTSGYDSLVPVYASAGGKVLFAGWNSERPCNGYHVILDHDGDGNSGTGFQTYYLHLRSNPLVSRGETVSQGVRLGTLGNSGSGQGCGTWSEHLHFQVKYKDGGGLATDALTFVKVESRELREYLTDCDSSHNRNRYYPSTNTAQ